MSQWDTRPIVPLRTVNTLLWLESIVSLYQAIILVVQQQHNPPPPQQQEQPLTVDPKCTKETDTIPTTTAETL
jgi:hypothetical protein